MALVLQRVDGTIHWMNHYSLANVIVWVGWGKLNRTCKVSNDFFFWGGGGTKVTNSSKHMFGQDGRNIAIS